jgi:endonuclease YncB( thermonuclease family)
MRRILSSALLLLGLVAPSWAGEPLRVIDGDTVANSVGRMRLYGIDAPEWSPTGKHPQPWGKESTACLQELLDTYPNNQGITGLQFDCRTNRELVRIALEYLTACAGVDGTGRCVGHLDVSTELVRRGCAHWYRAYATHDDALRQAEAEAQAAKRGLWAQEHIVAPWDWRRGRR